MSALGLYDTIWAVIFPIVGWPFGVFLLKQFAEGIPTEMVEACRIDGANEWRTFTDVMFPMSKRILSAVLSLVIVLQMLPGGLTLTAFAADSLSKSSSQLALGMNIIPQHLSQDEVFLKNYVKVNGNAMNINKLFTKGETSNVKGADDNGGGIPTGTLKQNKSKFWYAEYIWNINETQKKIYAGRKLQTCF